MRRRTLAALLVTVAALPALARAKATAPLKLRPALELPLLGAGVLLWGGSEAAKGWLVPATCRWCERDPAGQVVVNGFDRTVRSALVGRLFSPPTWSRTSDVAVFGVLPLASLGLDWSLAHGGRFDRPFAEDAGIVAESLVAAGLVDQLVKFVVARQRPYAAFQAPYASVYQASVGAADANLSFFSGHAAAALSVTVAASRLLELRTGRKLGYAVLVPLGVLASLMRIAADKHWATDVLTGMAVGALAGYLIPSLHTSG